MTVIVYSSKSGSAKKYAEILSEAVSLEAYPVGSQPVEEPVIFFGWIKGKEIVGLRKLDMGKLRAVCVVGLDDEGHFNKNAVSDHYGIKVPIYYLRGWIDRSRLGLADKAILMIVCVMMKLQGLNEFNQPIFDAMMNGGSFFDEKYLGPVETFILTAKN